MNKLSKHFFRILLVIVVTYLFAIPTYIISLFQLLNTIELSGLWIIFSYTWGFLVTSPLQFGLAYSFLKAARDEIPEVKDLTRVLDNYWNIVLAVVLYNVIILVGLFVFIIPGIYFLCKLAFVRYLVIEEKLSATDAISKSWRMTNGYTLEIFMMGLLAIPVFIGGLLLFGIGVILSDMWVETSFASMYHAVKSQSTVYTFESTVSPKDQGPFI